MIVVTLSFCAFQPKNRWLTCCLTEQWRKSFGNQFLADLSAVGCSLKSLCNHFVSRKLRMGTMRGRMMCPSSFLAVIWALWKERNQRCFEGKSATNACDWHSEIHCCLLGSQIHILPEIRWLSMNPILVNCGGTWLLHSLVLFRH